MGSTIAIRALRPDDGPAFFALRRGAILSGCRGDYPPETLQSWTGARAEKLKEPLAAHFYAGFDGALVVTGLLDLAAGRIDALFVAAERQGEGLGRLMMAHLEAIARKHRLTALHLDATLNAVPFYRRLGYSGEGPVEVASARGVVIAAVPMIKILTP